MSTEPPIFDCITHPALDGSWVHPRWSGGNTFQALRGELTAANVPWAFAVAMGTGDGWALEQYIQACGQPGPKLFPVAWCDPVAPPDFELLRAMGYCGIKMHPRLAGFEVSDVRLPDLIQAAHAADMILFGRLGKCILASVASFRGCDAPAGRSAAALLSARLVGLKDLRGAARFAHPHCATGDA